MNIHTPAGGLAVPTYGEVLEAHERIKPYNHRTPVLTGAEPFLKCENLRDHHQEP